MAADPVEEERSGRRRRRPKTLAPNGLQTVKTSVPVSARTTSSDASTRDWAAPWGKEEATTRVERWCWRGGSEGGWETERGGGDVRRWRGSESGKSVRGDRWELGFGVVGLRVGFSFFLFFSFRWAAGGI